MRLFVAVDLPEDIKQQIGMLQFGIPDAKWSKPENAHVTLCFLGDINDGDITDIGLSLGRIRAPAFDMQLDSISLFGNQKRPRILWVGVRANPALQHLQEKVATALKQANITLEERRFKPHITLARIQRSPYPKVRQYLTDNALFTTRNISIDHFTLFSSQLGHNGPHYDEQIIFDLDQDVPKHA